MTLTQINNVPTLRFPEFKDEWQQMKLQSITLYVDFRGKSPRKTLSGIPLITAKNIKKGFIDYDISKEYISSVEYYEVMKRGIPKVGDILFTTEAPLGNVAQVDNTNIALAQRVIKFTVKDSNVAAFLKWYMLSPHFQALIKKKSIGSTVKGIQGKVLHKLMLSIPHPNEQQKIADFLAVVDEKVATLQKEIDLLKKYKKGIMQQIFTQKIRFKDENNNDYPDWDEKSIDELFTRITEKNKENNSNVLTISAQLGLINQEEFFNKSVAAKDLTGYYLLHKGDFAYNKSYSNGYPMGAIKKLNKYNKGIVSSLYICFKTKPNNSSDFFEQYFDSGLQNREIEKIAQEGARNHGLLNISVLDFFEQIFLLIPTYEEQKKIANFLSSIDDKLQREEKKLAQAKKFKKSLLQQVFV